MSSENSDGAENSTKKQVEVLFFNVRSTSLPLNFSVFANPIMLNALNVPNSGAVLIKGPTGRIVAARAISDPECPQTDLITSNSIMLSLNASVGDSVPMLAFNGSSFCDAIKIKPLFYCKNKNEYSSIVTSYLQRESHLLAPDTVFHLVINNVLRPFMVYQTIPDDRCFTTEKTRVFFADPPTLFEDEPILRIHFSDLVLQNTIKETVRNSIWLPLHECDLFKALKFPISNGLMAYGAPGNGKTSFLHAIANYVKVRTRFVFVENLVQLPYQQLVKKLNEVFDFNFNDDESDDEEEDPNGTKLLIFDNIDLLVKNLSSVKFAPQRRIIALFYSLLDNAMKNNNIAVIASAKSPAEIDDALIRPGRFNNEINLDMTTQQERVAIIRMNTRGLNISSADINTLASQYTSQISRKEIVDGCFKAICKLILSDDSNCDQINDLSSDKLYSFTRKDLKITHFGLNGRRFSSVGIEDEQPKSSKKVNEDDVFGSMRNNRKSLQRPKSKRAQQAQNDDEDEENYEEKSTPTKEQKDEGDNHEEEENDNIINKIKEEKDDDNRNQEAEKPRKRLRNDPFAKAAVERAGNMNQDDKTKKKSFVQDDIDNPFGPSPGETKPNPFGSSSAYSTNTGAASSGFPTRKYIPPT